MGQAVSFFEHPDERVALKLKEITYNSCRCIKKTTIQTICICQTKNISSEKTNRISEETI